MSETAPAYECNPFLTRCDTHDITYARGLACPACSGQTDAAGVPLAPLAELAAGQARIADLEGRLQAAQEKIRAQQRALGDANRTILKLQAPARGKAVRR